MNKFILTIAAVGILATTSCGNTAAANKMADELCLAMEKYKEDDPMSMLDAASDMMDISKKTDEYGQVSDTQLKKAMLKKCPDGWKKFETLKGK